MRPDRQTRLRMAIAVAAMAVLTGACGTVSMSPEAMAPTVVCLDGNFGYGPRREGICAKHDGVSRWLDMERDRTRHE